MFDWILNTSLHPSSQDLFKYFREITFAGKKGRIKNESLQVLVKRSGITLVFARKSHYIISLNEKIKQLKFLFTNLLKAKE